MKHTIRACQRGQLKLVFSRILSTDIIFPGYNCWTRTHNSPSGSSVRHATQVIEDSHALVLQYVAAALFRWRNTSAPDLRLLCQKVRIDYRFIYTVYTYLHYLDEWYTSTLYGVSTNDTCQAAVVCSS